MVEAKRQVRIATSEVDDQHRAIGQGSELCCLAGDSDELVDLLELPLSVRLDPAIGSHEPNPLQEEVRSAFRERSLDRPVVV